MKSGCNVAFKKNVPSGTSYNPLLNRNISYQIIFPLNKHVEVTTIEEKAES